jgi:histidinol-phosphatase
VSTSPLSTRNTERWLGLLHDIADRADAIALSHFRSARLRVDDKSDGSPVSEADRAIEAMARELIAARAPELGVLGEEEGESTSQNGARLIIDPIDGTRNFVRGIPIFASLLAIEDGGIVTAGVVSAPALGQRWHAGKGEGAYCGTRRLRVSSIAEIARAHVFHGDLGGRAEGSVPSGLTSLLRAAERTRGFGDFYQHVLVAEGAGDVALDFKMQPWDIAALKVIVEEAGGSATSIAGEDSIYRGSLMSTNGALHAAARALLHGPGSRT